MFHLRNLSEISSFLRIACCRVTSVLPEIVRVHTISICSLSKFSIPFIRRFSRLACQPVPFISSTRISISLNSLPPSSSTNLDQQALEFRTTSMAAVTTESQRLALGQPPSFMQNLDLVTTLIPLQSTHSPLTDHGYSTGDLRDRNMYRSSPAYNQ